MNGKSSPRSWNLPRALLPGLALFLFSGLSGRLNAQTVNIDDPHKQPALTPEAAQIAQQLGIAPLLQRLSSRDLADNFNSFESLGIHQAITERVVAASLEIDSANAVIDYELERIRSTRSSLQSNRDHAQNLLNVASFVTSGAVGVTSAALQFKSGTANLGNAIGVAGGAAGVILSVIAMHKQAGGTQPLGQSPRMLAAFFGRPPSAPEPIPSEYPAEVWAYLNSAAPAWHDGGTRREQLIAKWQREGRVEKNSVSSPEGPKVEYAVGEISNLGKLRIDGLNDRESMLLDVRVTISLMKRSLSEIVMSAATPELP